MNLFARALRALADRIEPPAPYFAASATPRIVVDIAADIDPQAAARSIAEYGRAWGARR